MNTSLKTLLMILFVQCTGYTQQDLIESKLKNFFDKERAKYEYIKTLDYEVTYFGQNVGVTDDPEVAENTAKLLLQRSRGSNETAIDWNDEKVKNIIRNNMSYFLGYRNSEFTWSKRFKCIGNQVVIFTYDINKNELLNVYCNYSNYHANYNAINSSTNTGKPTLMIHTPLNYKRSAIIDLFQIELIVDDLNAFDYQYNFINEDVLVAKFKYKEKEYQNLEYIIHLDHRKNQILKLVQISNYLNTSTIMNKEIYSDFEYATYNGVFEFPKSYNKKTISYLEEGLINNITLSKHECVIHSVNEEIDLYDWGFLIPEQTEITNFYNTKMSPQFLYNEKECSINEIAKQCGIK